MSDWTFAFAAPAAVSAAGAASIYLGRRLTGSADAWRRGSVQTTGTVVGVRWAHIGNLDGDMYALATVDFPLQDGRLVRAESTQGRTGVAPRVGQQVPVRYRPEDPMRPRVGTVDAGFGSGVVFMVIGAVALSLGLPALALAGLAYRLWG